ncbi:MAG: hypothetical protein ACI9VS_002473, partial [Candidatus Binatia bacterium]
CSATSFGVESFGPKVSGGGVRASLTARLPGFEPFGFDDSERLAPEDLTEGRVTTTEYTESTEGIQIRDPFSVTSVYSVVVKMTLLYSSVISRFVLLVLSC